MTGSRVFLFLAWGTVLEEDTPSTFDHPYFPYSNTLAIALVTLGFVFISAVIMRPFLNIIAWALAFTVTLHPISRWLEPKIGNRSWASCLAVLAGALVIGLPASWVIRMLLTTSIDGLQEIVSQSGSTSWLDPSLAPPQVASLLSWLDHTFHLQAVVENFIKSATQRLPNILTLTLLTITQFGLVLFTAFFFIRDRRTFFQYLVWISPLQTRETAHVASRIVDTIHACLFGIVLMAILQGALGALIFWWLELPQPALWGAVMGLLAIVPYLGAFLVWIPTAVVLAMHGAWTDAIILCVWGGIVIGLADNFLYPVLVGRRLHYHSLLVFFFLLGGVLVFGSAGVVLGPIVLSVTHSLLDLWHPKEERAKPHHDEVLPDMASAPIEPPAKESHGLLS
jgi:predicted PurR-regulated permease PerM